MGATDTITFNRILTTAAGWHASDLHFVVGNQPTLRIDGKLKLLEDEQIITPEFIDSISKLVLSEQQQQQLLAQKELTSAFSLNPQARFKVTAIYQRGSLALSLHVISSTIPRLQDLALPEAVTKLTTLTKGLVLVTGPYGSGKTTTLNAMVSTINDSRATTIVTIESPIEHLLINSKSLIEQREIGRDALSYEQAIVAASREDIDVIVVSEAGSSSVIAACLDAAEASRLVLTTMTTNSVLGTVEKVLNSFSADETGKVRAQFASVLAGIVSQRLLPRIGGGQVVVSEVLIPTPPVRAVIRDGALFQLANVLQTSGEGGHVSFDRTLQQLVADGVITKEDAMINAQDPNIFANQR